MTDSTDKAVVEVDVAIAGGGIAGAWLLRLLTLKGYRAALFESAGWGADQTLASQGMIHGGLKYALSGSLTGASEAIASMPQRWRACIAGNGEINLNTLRLISDRYFMFAAASTLGKLTTFFAAKSLRGRIDKLNAGQRPEAFSGFDGELYALNDFVIDTQSLLDLLTHGMQENTWHQTLDASNVTALSEGWQIDTHDQLIRADTLISCAGNGSQHLLDALHIESFAIQQRPLKQVSVRPRHATALWGHCLTGIKSNEPRLTITSHHDEQGLVWYLGGKLATDGVARSDQEQIQVAQSELEYCVPWLDWRDAKYRVHFVDRAEPKHLGGLRPDQAYAERAQDFVLCFPTKLTLTPDLGDRVLQLLVPPKNYTGAEPASTRPVPHATPPWSAT